jgi:APA family basic amino acid/polyamine antiporter
LTIGHAVLPDPWARVVAVGAVVLVLGVNAFGITRTALASWVIVGFVLTVLVALLVATLAVSLRGGGPPSGMSGPAGPDGFGVLRAAGLLFFAFAGYARVATLGEEVRDPKRTIPRAITVALLVTLVVYGLVCAAVLTVLGTDGVAASLSPVVATARAAGPAWLPVLVTVAAVVAAAGSLLALTAGVGRTTLAMAREGDLPAGLSRLDRRHSTPWVADVVLGVIVCALVSTGDITTVIGFSSFAVLVYYLVANLSAFRQQGAHRLSSPVVQVIGAAGCVALACSLPIVSVLAGLAVLLLGVGYRIVRRRLIGTPT